MAARTDIHAPGSIEFDPESYEVLDVYDTWAAPLAGTIGASEGELFSKQISNLEYGGWKRGGNQHGCSHCGQTNIRYAAVLVHQPSHEYLVIGQQCLGHRFLSQTKASFAELRKRAELDRKAQKRLAAFRQLCDDAPALAFATYSENVYTGVAAEHGDEIAAASIGWACNVQHDIARKARQYGDLSAKQAQFLDRLVTEAEGKVAEIVGRFAKQAEVAANTPKLVEGRRELTGTVLSVQFRDNDFGGAFKALIELSDGNKLWGTVPSSVLDVTEKGVTITFTAKVERSTDDAHFGFYSRPTKASVTI